MLIRYKIDGVSVLAVLDRRRKKKNGGYPVKIEVVSKGVQKYFPTGQDLTAQEWEELGSGKRTVSETYLDIQDSFGRVKKEVKRLVSLGLFSFRRLNAALGGSELNLQQSLKKKMDEALDSGRINSYYRYKSVLGSLERMSCKTVSFKGITSEWLRSFHTFLQKEGKSCTTINIYMSAIKSVVSDAVSEGYILDSDNPFGSGKYRIPPSAPRHIALTDRQIENLMKYRGTETEERYLDLWLFSYMCNGINFMDMLFLKYANVAGGEISFTRSKTFSSKRSPRVIKAVLTARMKKILERWGNEYTGNPDTFLFKYAKGDETQMEKVKLVRKVNFLCNRTLRQIARKLEIPRITVYSARHSYASVLQRRGVDVSLISEALGHSSLATTRNYLGGSDETIRKRIAELLLMGTE